MKYQVGCPIRKFMDQSLFSAPHDLSQSITSFIASYCQGIHQTPFSRLIWSRKSQTFSESKVVILRFRSDYSDPTVWLFTSVKIIVLNSCHYQLIVTHIPSYQLTLMTWWLVKIIWDDQKTILVSVFWLGKTVNHHDIGLSHTHWRVIAGNTRIRTLVGLQNCERPLRDILLTRRTWQIRKTYVSCILCSLNDVKVSEVSDC